jgi:predicted acylesterase/phospholipase RssA
MLPRIIVLSGGGIKAVGHIGALQRLDAAGYLSAVRTWVGLSAGALVAFGICIGYTLPEIHDICNRFDFAALQDPAPDGFLSFLDHYGIDTGDRLYRFIHALLTVRGLSADLRFRDMPTRRLLRIVATDMTSGRPVIYSTATTPDVKVADALRASMSLPFYFWPVHDESGHMLVDGGVNGNYPMNLLSVEEQEQALGILLSQDLGTWLEEGPDSYVQRLYEIVSNSKSEILYRTFEERTIRVATPHISMVKFTLDAADRAALCQAGADAADRFIRRRRGRRASI